MSSNEEYEYEPDDYEVYEEDIDENGKVIPFPSRHPEDGDDENDEDENDEAYEEVEVDLVGVNEAAEMAGASPQWIRNQILEGDLPAQMISGRWIMSADDVEAFLDELD